MSSKFTIDGLVYTQTSSEEVSVKKETCSNSSYSIPEFVINNGKTFKGSSVVYDDAFARTNLEYDEFVIPENTEKNEAFIFCNTKIKRLKISKKLVYIPANPMTDSHAFAYYDVDSENPKYSF